MARESYETAHRLKWASSNLLMVLSSKACLGMPVASQIAWMTVHKASHGRAALRHSFGSDSARTRGSERPVDNPVETDAGMRGDIPVRAHS